MQLWASLFNVINDPSLSVPADRCSGDVATTW